VDGNYRSISQAGEILVTDELEHVGTIQGKPSTLLIFDWVRRHGIAGVSWDLGAGPRGFYQEK